MKCFLRLLPIFVVEWLAIRYLEKFRLEIAGESWVVVNPWDDVIFIVNKEKIEALKNQDKGGD